MIKGISYRAGELTEQQGCPWFGFRLQLFLGVVFGNCRDQSRQGLGPTEFEQHIAAVEELSEMQRSKM